MLNDILGVLVVHAAILALIFVLSRRGLLDHRDSNQTLGVYLVVAPIGLLAWLRGDITLALIIPIALWGAMRLLSDGRRHAGSGSESTL